MMTTKLLLHFHEPAGIHPSDAMGNLDDLGTEGDLEFPTVADGTWTGRGRLFSAAGDTGLVAGDLSGRDTLLQRDVTIQAICSVTVAAGVWTLIQRGLDDGTAAERVCYALRLQESAVASNCLEVWFEHETSGGTSKPQPPGVFQHVGDGKLFLLTATRRWESSTKIVCRYYVDDEMIAELETADGEIGGGTTGHTSVGAAKSGGTWGSRWTGVIDDLKVTDHEMSPAEVRETWRRLTVHQPAGVAMFAGLIPRGAFWYDNPSNKIGRRVKVVGERFGLVIAAAEQLRELFLPDNAPLAILPRWERLLGISPRPRDSLDARRARVLAFLAREQSMAVPSVQDVLAELLAADAGDIEILEFTNEDRDDFDELSPERWIWEGDWSVASGELAVNVPTGSDVTLALPGADHIRASLDTGGDGRLFVQAKLDSWTLEQDTGVGILLRGRRAKDALWFGVLDNGGTLELGWRAVVADVATAWTALVSPAPAAPLWLRIYTDLAADADTDGTYTFAWSTTGPSTGYTTEDDATGLVDPEWVGFAVFGTETNTGGDIDATFDDFVSFAPGGDRPFWWYAYRDPALSGVADAVGAQALLAKVRPAHTFAGVTQSLHVLCDDARDGLCDRGPLGGDCRDVA